MNTIGLYVSIPVAGFRVPRAREYFETFPIPPPATVYGMLLSMIGETNRRIYEGTEIAIALLSSPEYSVVLRTLWRVKSKNYGLGLGENRRPDFQELLTDVRLAIWVRNEETSEDSLAKQIRNGFENPSAIDRFGGLALGESTHLVDEVKILEGFPVGSCQFLLNNDEGDLSLPIWADHIGSNTNWGQYSLRKFEKPDSVPEKAWSKVERKPVLPTTVKLHKPQPTLFD